MNTKRAVVLLLLAFFVMLSPLAFKPVATGAADTAFHLASHAWQVGRAVRTLPDTNAVMPQIVSLPIPHASQGMPAAIPLIGSHIGRATRRLCSAHGPKAAYVPAQAVQCYMDHPHHAPPRRA